MKKGYVLVMVLAIVMVLSMGILAVIKSTGGHTTLKIRNLQELKAQYLVEAGLTYAFWVCDQPTLGCATLVSPGKTLLKATTGFDQDINITAVPPTTGTSYTIKVNVAYPDA